MLSEYRQRFSDYHACFHREDFLFRSGIKEKRETAHVCSEYSDLFAPSAIASLRAKLAEISPHLETERTSVSRLIAFAAEGHVAARARAVLDEIESSESNARIDWPGAQDLRAEAFEKMHNGARELGYENYLALHRELRGVDREKLAAQADRAVSKTESAYASALASLLAREANVSIDDATQADLGFRQRITRFDHFFPRERMTGIYRELFAALGFNSDKQSNVEVDRASRQNKQPPAFCSPIRIPDEIKLSVNLLGGQANYREFLRAAGRAQHFAWTSRHLYPEFRIGGDRAVGEAWGLLFENLMLDQHWLAGTFGFVESAQFRRTLAVFGLMAVRRCAALLNYETEFHAGKLMGHAGARYAELMTGAVRVKFDETDHLRELDDAFCSESFLRGCAFEAQMREYLKTQFGVRWWAARKAGETLIDLWNTGQQYTVEELASMIGLGELDFDCLVNEHLDRIEK